MDGAVYCLASSRNSLFCGTPEGLVVWGGGRGVWKRLFNAVIHPEQTPTCLVAPLMTEEQQRGGGHTVLVVGCWDGTVQKVQSSSQNALKPEVPPPLNLDPGP
jgi:hypothetical protein